MEKQEMGDSKSMAVSQLQNDSRLHQSTLNKEKGEIINVYMGIDIGSVSLKILLLDENEEIMLKNPKC